MRYEARFLSDGEQARVHETSLRILAEVGVRVHGEVAPSLLAQAGAEVDAQTGVARIPAGLVDAALARAPRSFTLGARNPSRDFLLPSPVTRFAMDGTAAFAQDFATGERRYGTRQDIVDAMRLLQACDLAVMGWPPVAASDQPVGSRPVHEFVAMLGASSMHGQHELHRRDQAPSWPPRWPRSRAARTASASATRRPSSTARWRRSSTTARCWTRTSTSAPGTSR